MTPLEDLLQQCTVKITIPSGWGTGFFVAPGLILTCAHVVRKAADLQVTVSYPVWQQPLSAIVKAKEDDGKTLDLALVELSEPLPDHPCVFLDEEPVAVGQALYSYGYLESYTNAAPVRPVNEGLTGDTPPLLKLQGAQIEKGISGAALLNLKSGKVCGMVKETRAAGFDLGGGAIPTRVILEQFPQLRELQQAFHRGDRRWLQGIANLPHPGHSTPEIDFRLYRESIIKTYEKWWQYYTLTDAEGKLRKAQEPAQIFDFGLMVQTVKQEQDQLQQEKVERFSVLDGLRKYALGEKPGHVLLVGRPGSGKSTALARLMLEEATLTPNSSSNAGREELNRIPVLVELRYWQGSIAQLILNAVKRHEPFVTTEQLGSVLTQSLILFDGVNELPSEDARSQLMDFRRNHLNLPMIFTTRDLSLGGDVGIARKLEMQPLTEEQMQAFIRAYIPGQTEAMLRQLKEQLREFGQTPLLLWMLCEVFQQAPDNQLPSNLGGVFQSFSKMYEASSVRKHEVTLLKGDVSPLSDRRLWKKALMVIASIMMQGGTPADFRVAMHRDEAERELGKVFPHEQFPVRDILDDLLKYHLLQNRSVDQIEFRHQLIQEYYAAEWLLGQLPTLTDDQLKQDYLNYLKWTEPFALMLALVDEEIQALRVVKLAMDEVDLMLGARLAGEVKPTFQAQTVEFVEDLKVPDWLKAELLGETRSEHAIDSLKFFMANKNPDIRTKAVFAFGRIVNDAAISELCDATYDESETVRGMVANSLGKIGTELAGSTLKQWKNRVPKETPYVDIRRQTSLWEIFGDEEKPYLFREIVVDDDFDFDQPNNLSYTDLTLDFHTLEHAVNNEIPQVRQFVAGELRNYQGSLYEESVVNLLINFISDPDSFVRQIAFKELQNYLRSSYQNRVVNVFQKIMKNSTPDLRVLAVERLQDYSDLISKKEASNILIKMANDSSFNVRLASIRVIEKMAESTFLPVLHQALNDEIEVRRLAAKALGEIAHKDSVQALIQAMTNYPNDRTFIDYIIKALGKIGGSLAVEVLGIILLGNRGETVEAALKALGDTKHSLAAQFLLKANYDSQQSSSSWLELQRIKALGETAGGDLLLTLIKSLKIASEQDYSEALSAAIVYIQNRCKYYNYEIWQAHQAAQQADYPVSQTIDPNAITIQPLERLTIMTKAPIFNQQYATIGVNYAAEGSKVEFTQHTSSSEQTFEILLTDYQQFIQQLQQKYPTLADTTTIPQIIEVEAKLIETQDRQRWQNFLTLKQLWNGGKKATFKLGEHFTEDNLWGKMAIAFLEGVSEDGK